jgi:hypothetical protein
MKQEILEEAAENLTTDQIAWRWLDIEENYNSIEDTISFEKGVEIGAKYQAKRMYSEEEVKDMMFEILNTKREECCVTHTKDSIIRKVFEQFKKK